MDSCGLLYGSREYTEDCLFNETIEQHNYNTYSSVRWSTSRKTLYLGLNRHGVPRRVQAKGHNLGRLSAYARVLTQLAPMDRVEALQKRMTSQHNIRHQFNGRHQYYNLQQLQQYVCPMIVQHVQNTRDRFRCRRRKSKKKTRKCQDEVSPCESAPSSGNGTVDARKSCQPEDYRKDSSDAIVKKRKSRIDRKSTPAKAKKVDKCVDGRKVAPESKKKVDKAKRKPTKMVVDKDKMAASTKAPPLMSTEPPESSTPSFGDEAPDSTSKYLDVTMDTISSEVTEENFYTSLPTVLKFNGEDLDWDSSESDAWDATSESSEIVAM